MNKNDLQYYRKLNRISEKQSCKDLLINEMTQEYDNARENTIYRFNVLIGSNDAKDVYINGSDTFIKGVIDVKRQQTADTEMQETIQVYPNQIKRGDYLRFKVNDTDVLRDYIITSKIDKKDGYDEGIFKECNHLLKWMYKGELYETMSLVTNNTKYTAGIKSESSAGIVEQNAMFGVLVPDIAKTKMLGLDQRFIINGMAWKVTLPDRTNDGLAFLTLGKSSIIQGVDDIDNEIANRWEVTLNYNTTCDNSISITKDSSYNLVYSFTDNNQPIDSNLITIENTSNLISIVKSNDGKINITGIDIGTGSFKVKLNLTDEVREFVVNFDIVSNVVPDKIDYTVTSSNGYTFIKMVGATISCNKLINGVADTTLQVDYKVPTNIQTLIANGSLSITQKTDNSIYIRNISVTTLTTFVIEFYDKITGNKVSETPTISLKGA
jgi:hypothetical protein